MNPLAELISEADFHDSWGVFTQESGDLFTYSEISNQPPSVVWTIVDSDGEFDGNWYAIPGIHHVNCLGFVLTRRQWVDASIQAIYFEDDVQQEEIN